MFSPDSNSTNVSSILNTKKLNQLKEKIKNENCITSIEQSQHSLVARLQHTQNINTVDHLFYQRAVKCELNHQAESSEDFQERDSKLDEIKKVYGQIMFKSQLSCNNQKRAMSSTPRKKFEVIISEANLVSQRSSVSGITCTNNHKLVINNESLEIEKPRITLDLGLQGPLIFKRGP